MKGFTRVCTDDELVYISTDRKYILRHDSDARRWRVTAVGRPGKRFVGWKSLPEARASIEEDRNRIDLDHDRALAENEERGSKA